MTDVNRTAEKLIAALKERQKELECLYEVEEILTNYDTPLESILLELINVIPIALQYSDSCFARVKLQGKVYSNPDNKKTKWVLKSPIEVYQKPIGFIEVYYTRELPQHYKGSFTKDEVKLISTIAGRLGQFVSNQRVRTSLGELSNNGRSLTQPGDWQIIVSLLRKTDQELFLRIARKMMNHLCWNGVMEADTIIEKLESPDKSSASSGHNFPMQRNGSYDVLFLSEEIFRISSDNLPDVEIFNLIKKWMQEDRASFLIRTLINLDSTLTDISDAVRRFHHLSLDTIDLSDSTRKGVKVALVRRFLSDQLEFIKVAKEFVEVKDFISLIPKLIHPVHSHGKLGGKSAGLFLASRILKRARKEYPELAEVKVPKTWYITSDGLHTFLHYNNLEDITEQKYKVVDQARQEHPHIVHLFKSSHFPPEIKQGLSMALDDFGEVPLIVRSSSLLEDRLGSAFSGKYDSLFLANQGTKEERLEAIMDAVAEVYSSTFGSDPIQYRSERGLIDFHEEMGIMIQEVVGAKAGKYFFPTFAGVAFSNNEFRWSPRIKREDGLIRLVPGLGTRAVDRLSDDYSVLVAPGLPNLRVNVTVEETVRYAPKYMDVINLETNEFETVSCTDVLKDHGSEIPSVEKLVSVIEEDHIKHKTLFNLDFEEDDVVLTFEGLIHKSPFVKQMSTILSVLKDKLDTPVDIEFASSGKNFYLLQCRPQSYTSGDAPAPIPKDIPENAVVFTANKYISNGLVPDITHIVYVDPVKYSEVSDLKLLKKIGRAIGQLNQVLPKRQFILMGPGRWGSRGDIKLGVNVTYSDINNTTMLIEIARQKGNYVPDLSFGTHFFQDLVEASIRYLPLYPDDTSIIFNEPFLANSPNILSEIAPDFDDLEDVVRVIDVQETMQGKILKVFMNADIDEAVAILTTPTASQESEIPLKKVADADLVQNDEDHWKWRQRMVDRIATQIPASKYGVKGMYLFGSTKNGTASPESDIDILLHIKEQSKNLKHLESWLEGWSNALAEMNYLRTGFRSEGLLDVHFVTDSDIEGQADFASKIGAVTDAAKEIPLGKK